MNHWIDIDLCYGWTFLICCLGKEGEALHRSVQKPEAAVDSVDDLQVSAQVKNCCCIRSFLIISNSYCGHSPTLGEPR